MSGLCLMKTHKGLCAAAGALQERVIFELGKGLPAA